MSFDYDEALAKSFKNGIESVRLDLIAQVQHCELLKGALAREQDSHLKTIRELVQLKQEVKELRK